MIKLTSVELIQYRAELSSNQDALTALEMIEECEGDLEDAAIALAIHVGQEPDRSDDWLDSLAKRWRVFLCSPEFREKLAADSRLDAIQTLTNGTDLPGVLATLVVVYVLQADTDSFCEPLEEKL